MKNIAIFYHCLFKLGQPPKELPMATTVIHEQMWDLVSSGLCEAAKHMIVGINGGPESYSVAHSYLPRKSQLVFHGLEYRNECATICLIEDWVRRRPGWLVFYFHSKGATHDSLDFVSTRWRTCMMHHLVTNWSKCVRDLEDGFDSVGCHWMDGPKTPPGQSIWAGNFWWAKSEFLATLPSIRDTARVKESGLTAEMSRYEAEVWIGNGPNVPRIKDYHPDWDPGKIGTCTL